MHSFNKTRQYYSLRQYKIVKCSTTSTHVY